MAGLNSENAIGQLNDWCAEDPDNREYLVDCEFGQIRIRIQYKDQKGITRQMARMVSLAAAQDANLDVIAFEVAKMIEAFR